MITEQTEYEIQVSYNGGEEWWISTSIPFYDKKDFDKTLETYEKAKATHADRSFRIVSITTSTSLVIECLRKEK